MTTETREALKGLAQVVKKLAAAVSLGENDAQFYPTIQLHADRLIRALEREVVDPVQSLRRPTGACPDCGGVGVVDSGGETPWGTGIDMPCPSCQSTTNYETWLNEHLDTLRKLFRQRGFSDGYKSFPDFCREQYEGSDKGKVKV